MKSLNTALQDHLDTGATTMAHCWRLTRKDGEVLGFTEHDNDLAFDGTTFEASSGFTASQIDTSLGLSVDNLNADGVLSSDSITEVDIKAGLYDDAAVELFWVNWQDVSERVLLLKGNLGQVQHGETAFSVELRSLADRLNQRTGRSFQRTCDALLGDARCGVNLTTFQDNVTVADISGRTILVTGAVQDDGYYAFGLMRFTSGNNDGLTFEVKTHKQDEIVLWFKPPFDIEVGDTAVLTAGCDKSITTCSSKFSNEVNFQGFNLIPGTDFVSRYANRGDDGEGKSIFNNVGTGQVTEPPESDADPPVQIPPVIGDPGR